MPLNHDLDAVLAAYLECALWSTTNIDASGDMGESFDATHDADDFTASALAECREDCANFLQDCEDSGLSTDLLMSDAQMGHDFWLTRNGHGAGFWDRGHGSDGDTLTELCKPYGSVDIYCDEAGLLHV